MTNPVENEGIKMQKFLVGLLIVTLIIAGYLGYRVYTLRSLDHLVVFFIRSTPTNFLLVPVLRAVPAPATPEKAVAQLLAGPTADEDLHPSIPQGTKLLDITVADRTATVNFSRELQDNFVGGSQLEAHMVEAIVNTLIQFPQIDQVAILIEGQVVESIAGHVSIDRLLP